MKTKFSLRFNNWLQLGLVLGICILANVISSERFLRVDLTKDGLHSLDIKVRQLVWNLEKPLYAKVFFTRDIEGQHRNNELELLNKLEELRAYSQGMLIIERIDPASDSDKESMAQGFGIEPTTIFHKDQRKTTLKKAYMGLAFVYGDRQETLPPIQTPQTLEYDLAKALRKIRSSEKSRSVLAFSLGHGETDIVNGKHPPLQKLTAELRENHDVRALNLGDETGIPDDVDVLWVVGPQKPLSRTALIQLDQFLMRGGSLGVFPSGVKPDVRDWRGHRTTLIQHGLDAFLAHFGVTVNKDLLVDRKHNETMDYTSLIGFRPNKQPILKRAQINHPLMVRVSDLNQASVVNRGVSSLVFPFSSTLSLNEPLHPGIESQQLATSSDSSGRIVGVQTYKLDAYKAVNPGERIGAFPVLLALNGRWASFFAEDDLPEINSSVRLTEGAPARLVVSGSSSFVYNNPKWILNLADWMSQDEELIAIRSKMSNTSTLEPPEPDALNALKRLNLLLGPTLIWVLGLIWWAVRRRNAFVGRSHDA